MTARPPFVRARRSRSRLAARGQAAAFSFPASTRDPDLAEPFRKPFDGLLDLLPRICPDAFALRPSPDHLVQKDGDAGTGQSNSAVPIWPRSAPEHRFWQITPGENRGRRGML